MHEYLRANKVNSVGLLLILFTSSFEGAVFVHIKNYLAAKVCGWSLT